MTGRGIVAGAVITVSAVVPAFGVAGGGIVTPTTSTTTTTRSVIVSPTTTTTTLPSTFTTTTTSSPVIVLPTTTTTTTTATTATTTPATGPTIPPVVAGSTTTRPDPPATTNPGNVAISTTSSVLGVAGPAGEIPPDVFVRGVEVTQGIQDLQSRMPLVAGRRTTVRVHIGTSGGYIGAVDGALLVERPEADDVVLHPDNGPIPPGLDRIELDGALNFELDGALYAGGDATFTAQVWSAGRLDRRRARPGKQPDVPARRVPRRRDPDGVAHRPRRRRRAG